MTATPKPMPPTSRLVPIQPVKQAPTPSVKKPYVLKDHLMDHPFRNIKTQINESYGKGKN